MKFVPIRTQTGATSNPDYAAPTGATANLIAPNLIAFGPATSQSGASRQLDPSVGRRAGQVGATPQSGEVLRS